MDTTRSLKRHPGSEQSFGQCPGAAGLALAGMFFIMAAWADEGTCLALERHELLIDEFKAPLPRLEAVAPDGAFPVTAQATVQDSMIGGEFDVLVQLAGVQVPGARVWLAIENGLFHYHQDAGSAGSTVWHYDGIDGDPKVVHASTGLKGTDLTKGGALDRLAVGVVSNAGPIDLSLVLYSDVKNVSEITKTIPATDRPGTIWFPFSQLVASGGKGADRTAITAIVASLGSGAFTGKSVDLVLDRIAATADPGAPTVLHDQLRHRVSTAIYSLNFPGLNPFDAQAADDFTVPLGKSWPIGGFRFGAVYSPQPPSNPTADVTVFADDAGTPGIALFSETGVAMNGTNIPETWDALFNEARELYEGRYWASIQGNVPIGIEMRVNESNEFAGAPYHWRNPGGALSAACTDWKPGTLCLGKQPSLAFSILGPLPSGGGKANDDHYECFGNTGISVPSVRGLLANDTLGTGGVVKFDRVTPEGAEVDVAADGAFTYTPKNGFGGDDTFTYTLANGSKATVSISVRPVWFINNDPQVAAGSANHGTLADPFVSLGAYTASLLPRAGDIIFLHSGTYTGTLHLLDGQVVASKVDAFLAQPSSGWGDISELNLPPSFKFPQEPATIQSPSGDAVTLAKDNALIGIRIGTAPGGYAVKGRDFKRLTTYGVTIAGPGAGVDLENGCLDAKYTDISTSDAAGPALRWAFGLTVSDANNAGAWQQRSWGPQLNLAHCHISGPNGGIDARVFGSASAAITVTDNVIAGAGGVGFTVTSQDTSKLSATFTGNDVMGKQGGFWLRQEQNSTFTLPGFPGGDANAVRTFIQNNNVGTPSVFITGNIRF